jgi:putative FmdB family regulatory protein
MPLYEFQCLDCTKTFEKRLSFDRSREQTKCPTCESERTRKVFNLIPVIGGSSRAALDDYSAGPSRGGGCACGGGACGCHH